MCVIKKSPLTLRGYSNAILLVIPLVIVSLVMSGCAKNSLVGKWSGDGIQIEFKKNGTLIIADPTFPVAGRYKILDKGRLQISFEGLAALMSGVWVYTFEDGQLVLSIPFVGDMTLHKDK